MKKRLFILTVVSLVFLQGCSEENIITAYDSTNTDWENYEGVVEVFEKFRNDVVNFSTKSENAERLEITNITKQTLMFEISPVIGDISRTKANGLFNTSIDLYTLTFEKLGSKGYSIVTDDPRVSRVYAYTENGQLSDTTYNLGLAATLSSIPLICKKDIENHYNLLAEDSLSTKASQIKHVVIGPLVQTHWNQTAPYNGECPSGCAYDFFYEGRTPAGCTPVAIAQVIACLDKPSTRYMGVFDYSKLTSEPTISTFSSNADMVAKLVHHVGVKCNTKYDCKGSGALIESVDDLFYIFGYTCTFVKDANVNLNDLCTNLGAGIPHITCGYRKNAAHEGHTWIWDGIEANVTITERGRKEDYVVNQLMTLHCNWGHGGSSDGWFANYEQEGEGTLPYLDDNCQGYIWGFSRRAYNDNNGTLLNN